MGLLDDALAEVKVPGPGCVIFGLGAELHAEFAEALARPKLPNAAIARALQKRPGIGKVTAGIVGRHRANECTTCQQAGITW